MRLLIRVFPLFFALGCFTAAKKADPSLISGEPSEKLTVIQLMQSLVRGDTNSNNSLIGKRAFAHARPITETYIRVQERELGKKNLDSKETIEKKTAQRLKSLETNGCFEGVFRTENVEAMDPKMWKAKYKDSSGTVTDLILTKGDAQKSERSIAGEIHETNYTACGVKDKFSLPFTLVLIPQWDGSAENITLSWTK